MGAGILSLTRTPTNPLMWSHYADQHFGAVIGIDAKRAGFTEEKSNLIPAQYGGVLYASKRPNDPFVQTPQTGIAVGATHPFPKDHYEKLQRLFLTKPLCWAYEEEVRVVKCVNGLADKLKEGEAETESGTFKIAKPANDPYFLYELPEGAIREVYFGFRARSAIADGLYEDFKDSFPGVQFSECWLDNSGYAVGAQKYVSVAEIQKDMRAG